MPSPSATPNIAATSNTAATPSPASPASESAAQPRAQSAAAFAQARRLMPGGVSSPVRSGKAVDVDPVFIRTAKGAIVTDVDGNDYIDYVGSYGPLILGHAHESVAIALSKAVSRGWTYGMPTEAESVLAGAVIDAVPSIERIRFVNSGTEAVMSAIRLARAATGRPRIVKCTGCYHGHADSLLVEAGSGAMTLGVPSSPGVPESITANTLLVPFNDLAAVERVFEQHRGEIACMAVEPVAGNMGCVPPVEGYLQGLRELCDRFNVLLLFDEVMTGFRVAYGGAQTRFDVRPDLTCLGKIIGGGLPCAAYGGREDLMRQVAPEGPVYQAGTLSGNPLAMAAGIATLEALRHEGVYENLETQADTLAAGLRQIAGQVPGVAVAAANEDDQAPPDEADGDARPAMPVQVSRVGSMLTVFFCDQTITNYEQARQCNTARYAAFFRSMLEQGVILPPSQYEAWFVSTAHDRDTIDKTLAAAATAFEAARNIA